METAYKSVAYAVEGRVATITLNRPARLNAIDEHLPSELRHAVERANRDDGVHVIVLTGAGRGFCAGYDLQDYAQRKGTNQGVQEMPWDPTVDFKMMYQNTSDFMSLWKSHKPTIAKVRGPCVAGGSDIALCCDIVVASEDSRFGYPPARVWGVPTTSMWLTRLGPEKAKLMMFTGRLIPGKEAERIGLISECVANDALDSTVAKLAANISAVPKNQLLMHKAVINSAVDQQGLPTAQILSTVFDGVSRHSPEGMWFKEESEKHGYKEAVRKRDSGEPIAPGTSRPFPYGSARL
eukprot:TRINITY_DN29622_c1_g1_i1.p2 TRINITY_DN29622_c1_g1~~TRINITY_DN29622_c1_g1_i1.p2  ORF type:complete len:316 (+),score=118.62 TRINITY_DN29622_c1_g1_i1:67-948(+)